MVFWRHGRCQKGDGWRFTSWFCHFVFWEENVWQGIYNLIFSFWGGGYIEHLSAVWQNFISMAISLGIVWSGLLSKTYYVRAFWVANCPGLIEETRLKKQNFPDLFGSRVLSSKLFRTNCGIALRVANCPGFNGVPTPKLSRTYCGNAFGVANWPGFESQHCRRPSASEPQADHYTP